MHISIKQYIKYQHLDRNAIIWLVFSSGMESTHTKKVTVKGY